ncbi:hypothetical protein OXPF_41010 [Oxobacter pfennigii]|uniref:VTT domain-containing protein n=1 Tax=Oxobacter pfennigii TaxID=36849 RepID=A0A0P8W3X8_9CLOT|nr:DedA family protein [Oxobacter pfennigii]KPU42316.1 hypothetical protein OXPF_41010 [Oxobacter pfennigii]
MQNWITEFMGQFGYLGIFLLIAIENIFPPIPSEIILTFGGFMTTYTKMTFSGVVLYSTAGSVGGAIVLYKIGHLYDGNKMEKIIDRYGHILKVKNDDINKASSWFRRYGNQAVFFCRMVPLIRSLISIPAGMSKMKFTPFLLFTVAGSLIWNILLVGAGALLGENWHKIVEFMDIYSNITYFLLGAAGIIIIALWAYRRRRIKLRKEQE